jgi:flagellar hook-associated protein 1 FlgK
MSLSLALQNALSGLNVNQRALSVTSNNIANANTDGYTRKNSEQESVYIDKQPSGVRSTGITRKVDEYLNKATRIYGSEFAKSTAVTEYFEQVQLYLGKPGTDNTVTGYIDLFFNSLKDFTDNPESASLRQNAVNSAVAVADEIASLAASMEDLRFQADQQINQSVGEINTLLTQLYDTNVAINNSFFNDFADPGLLDKRDSLMAELSGFMDFKTFYRESGAVTIYTGPGVPLVDVDRIQLKYTPTSSAENLVNNTPLSSITAFPVNSQFVQIGEGQEIASSGVEGSITTVLRGGRLKGLLDIRDKEIPAILAQLDEMASTMRDSFNAIHNDGTGYPPPTSLTGTKYTAPTDYRDWTGDVQFGILNQDGRPLPNVYADENGGIRPLTMHLGKLDLGDGLGRLTTQDIMDEFNSYYGPQLNKTRIGNMNDVRLVSMTENNPAGLNFDLDFDFENISDEDSIVRINGVTLSSGVVNSPAVFPTTDYTVVAGDKVRTGTGLSLDVTFGAAGVQTVDVDVEIEDELGNISTARLRYSINTGVSDIKNDRYPATVLGAPPTTGTVSTVAPTSFNRIARMVMVDEEGTVLPAGDAGYLKIEVEEETYGISIAELTSKENGILDNVPPIAGSERGLSHYFELNNFFVRNDFEALDINPNDYQRTANSAYNLRVRTDIAENPNRLAGGQMLQSLQPANLTEGPLYTYELGAGANQIAKRLAELSRSNVSFDAAGSLPGTSKAIVDYASDILGSLAANTKQSQSNAEKDRVLYEGFKSKAEGVSGVNVDEELGNTIIFQNGYTASARVISVARELFQTLLDTF